MWQDVASLFSEPTKCIKTSNSLTSPFFSGPQQWFNGSLPYGRWLAIEVTTNFWIGEDAFQTDTMPSGVRKTIKLWPEPGTSRERVLGGCDIWEGGWGQWMTKGSSLCGGTQGYSALALCARGSQSTELWVQCVNPYPLPSLITSPSQLHATQDFCLQLETNEWGESMQGSKQLKIRPMYSLLLPVCGGGRKDPFSCGPGALSRRPVDLLDIIITPRS